MFGYVNERRGRGQRALPRWGRPALPIAVVSVLLYLGLANIVARATWQEMEDGVLWRQTGEGVVASEVAAESPASRVGLLEGDLLLAIDDRPILSASDVGDTLHAAPAGATARYTILRLGTREVVDVRIAPAPTGSRALYFLLASVGIFTLLVGGAVRLRRPRDQATLHFFWLAVAFFGVFTFSFSGRFDRLDWAFYWGDVVSILLLPPLFLHFVLEFPERARRWTRGSVGRVVIVAIYLPGLVLGAMRVSTLLDPEIEGADFLNTLSRIDRLELAYLAICFVGGLAALTRALGEVRSVTAHRQLRWIAWGTALGTAPFAFGYALPYAAGIAPSLPMELSAIPLSLIPLAYASAIVRYRLMDVEVIVKRALMYAAVAGAILGIYLALLQGVEGMFPVVGTGDHNWVIALLVTLVALLLAPPVKHVVQTALDRAFYRDRYDYRRALVGFARDLNSDLDLNRLSERLVTRVVETLLVDRMALMLDDEVTPHFVSVRASGFGDERPPALRKRSGIGMRLSDGHVVPLDDPISSSRFAVEEIEYWRDAGLYYFVPCVATRGTIAVLALGRKDTYEPLSSEDVALLTAVAGQIATALENARLYRQLHVKAGELERLRAFNENILESLHDGLLVLDLEDRIVRWNRALEPLYGIRREDAIGKFLHEVFDTPFVEAVRAAKRERPDGASLSRVPLAARDTHLIVDAAVVPLRTASDEAVTTIGTIVIVEDVTRRVQLEEQLQISEKMASIGLLAAGVAHEVNTPLTGISSFTQMLLDGADPADPRTRLLEKIERQTFRAARIVNGLLSLSRPASGAGTDVAVVNLNGVVSDVLSLLEHQFDAQRLKVRRELGEGPILVMGFEHKLQQVFLNLFLNAKDAMPKGGWLSILTRVDGDRVVVEVSDTGSGIPHDHLTRIYDPFFTTKAIGQGTGLGLSVTYGIVREHQGTIDCDSGVGQGTKFRLEFPAAPAERTVRAARL
jgi:PAS domain S-box-containing protein